MTPPVGKIQALFKTTKHFNITNYLNRKPSHMNRPNKCQSSDAFQKKNN